MTDGLEQLHTEVFRGPTLDQVLDHGDRFFSVMPIVGMIAAVGEEESSTDQKAG
jgi:hypothetical protein